jgi:chromate transporter
VNQLGALIRVFALLSLLAVGGGTAVLPEMRKLTVMSHQWLTDAQFRDAYSLGQVAPGPNMLMVTVIGYRVAGAAGAAAVTLAFFLPACLLTLYVGRVWERFHDSPWRPAVQQGLAPVSIGLMCAGILSLARIAILDTTTLLFAVAVFSIVLIRHINPAWLILASAIAGLLLLAT